MSIAGTPTVPLSTPRQDAATISLTVRSLVSCHFTNMRAGMNCRSVLRFNTTSEQGRPPKSPPLPKTLASSQQPVQYRERSRDWRATTVVLTREPQNRSASVEDRCGETATSKRMVDAATYRPGPERHPLKAPGGSKHRKSTPPRCSPNRLSSKCMRQLLKSPVLLGAGLVYVVAAVLLTPWISAQIRSWFTLTREAAVFIVAIPLVLVPVCVLVAWTAILYRRGHL
jgi:hypothetical protein